MFVMLGGLNGWFYLNGGVLNEIINGCDDAMIRDACSICNNPISFWNRIGWDCIRGNNLNEYIHISCYESLKK